MYVHFVLVSMGTNFFITLDLSDLFLGLFLLQIKKDEKQGVFTVTVFFLNGLQ